MEQSADLAPRVATMLRARLVSTALDTAMAIMLVRLLPKPEFAVFGVAVVVYELAKQLAVGGFADSLLVLIPTAAEGTRRALAFRTARLLMLGGGLAALVTFTMAQTVTWWLGHWSPADQALLVRVLGAFAVVCLLEFPALPLTQLLLALNLQRAAGRWEVLTSIASLLSLIVPIALGAGVLGAATTLACWSALRLTISFFIARSALPAATMPLPPDSLKEQLNFALPLGLHTVVSKLNKYADKMIVTLLLSSAAFAEYAVAGQELPFVTLFPYVIGSVLASHYALAFNNAEPERAAQLWNAAVRKVSLVVVPAGVGCIVIAPDLIKIAFGEGYVGALLPFRIFSAALLLRVAQFGAVLQSARDTRSILKFSVITALTNICLGFALTKLFGIVGTASATLLTTMLSIVLYTRRIAMHFGTSWSGVWPVEHWLRTLGVALVAGAITCALGLALPNATPPVRLGLQVACFVSALVALFRASGLWGKSETRALRLLLGR